MASLARVLARNLHVSARRHALSKFAMPAMSPTMSEGGISQWKKKEGETFSAGDVLLEIETDKATIDVEAQEDGILAKIIHGDGSKSVSVGSTIAIVGEEGDDISAADAMAKEAVSQAPEPTQESKSEPPQQTSKPAESSQPKERSKPKEAPTNKGDRIFASPIAKKLALERGIPLAQVKGSGPNGRIVREDVENFKGTSSALSDSAVSSPEILSSDYTDIPLSNMRRVIGSRLAQSKQEIPHYYLTVDIDMGRILQLREVFNKALSEKDKDGRGANKLSVNDFILKGAACALAEVPEANSAWLGEVIRQYKKADISMAVATPTGLITPIIKDVGSKGLATISGEAKVLAKKARDGKLSPSEYQGGTFTISNLGMFDISHFTAIINPPQSCILAIGSTIPTLVPDSSEKGFTTKQIMKVTMSSDHRVVDGAVGARWLKVFKGYLENPLTFML